MLIVERNNCLEQGLVPLHIIKLQIELQLAQGTEQVLVAGTASVVGEDSHHAGDLEQQLTETYRNLAAVIGSADPGETADTGALLRCYENARVYVRNRDDVERVAASVQQAMPGLTEIETVHADICREELLVEIEGVASYKRGGPDK